MYSSEEDHKLNSGMWKRGMQHNSPSYLIIIFFKNNFPTTKNDSLTLY